MPSGYLRASTHGVTAYAVTEGVCSVLHVGEVASEYMDWNQLL